MADAQAKLRILCYVGLGLLLALQFLWLFPRVRPPVADCVAVILLLAVFNYQFCGLPALQTQLEPAQRWVCRWVI